MSRADRAALANAPRKAAAASRLAEYARLRSGGYSRAQAAGRLGVSPGETARRYERAITATAERRAA